MLDCVLCCVLAWYLNQVVPSPIGVRKPLWFPLLPSYWRGEKRAPRNSAALTRCRARVDHAAPAAAPARRD